MKTSLLLVFLFSLNFLFGQGLLTKTYSIKEGLPQEQVLSVFQDSIGRMWFGTNGGGVAIFDGEFIDFIDEKDGLSDLVIYDIKEYQNHIFLASNGGLFKLIGDSVVKLGVEQGLNHERIFKLQELNNKFFVATGKGVNVIDEESISPLITNTKYDSLPIIDFTCIDEYYYLSSIGNGVLRTDLKNERKVFDHTNGVDKYVFSTIQWKNKILFSSYNGLFVYDDILDSVTVQKKVLGLGAYNALADANGDLWVACEKGLYRINGNQETIYGEKEGLSNQSVWKIFKDVNGRLWTISKTNGFTLILNENIETFKLEKGANVNDILKVRNKTWLATQNGCAYIDSGKVKPYQSKHLIAVSDVYCLEKSEDSSTLYAGYKNNGLYVIKENEDEFLVSEKASFNRVFSVKCYKDDVYVGTQGGIGKVKNGKINPMLFEEKLSNVYSLEAWGEYLIVASEEGVFLFSPNDNAIEVLGLKKTRSIIVSDDNMYLASVDGLQVYNENGLSTIDKYKDLSNISAGCVSGRDLWLGVGSKVYVYDLDSGEELILDFPGGVVNRNAIQLVDGEVWVGGSDYLVKYQKGFDKMEFSVLNIKWKNIEDQLEEDELEYFLNDRIVDFPSYKNSFEFSVWSNDYGVNDKLIYSYSLNETEWKEVENPEKLTLSNLKYGDYKLRVKAELNGVTSNILELEFDIAAPFYLQWWFILICVLIILMGVYYNIRIQKANILITQKTEEIELKNRDIMDSISYAQRLQDAILPNIRIITSVLGEHFIYYSPKDIVSGDFYWLKEKGDKVIWSVVDCTGHGVPGAIVSMVGNSSLNRCVNEYGLLETNQILDKLAEIVEDSFNQEGGKNVKDGMDIALCSWDKSNDEFSFSGANNPCYVIRKGELVLKNGDQVKPVMEEEGYFLYEFKADKQPIGYYENRTPFKKYSFELKDDDSVFVFTDGYPDQFGGPKGKKFKYRPFKKLFLSMVNQPMAIQKIKLHESLESWKGDLEQVDDICIFAWKFNK